MRRNAAPSFAALATVLVTMLVLGVFIPIVQATNGAANSVRSRVLVDVYMKTQRDRRRRGAGPQGAARGPARQVGRVRLQAAAFAQQSKADPQAYQLLGANPLPDTFHVIPDNPGNVLAVRSALTPRGPTAAGTIDPAIQSVSNKKNDTQQDPRGHQPGDDHRRRADRAADDRLGPADRQHDPAVALRPAPRGRGDEARRRDRLVHPLAVRDRGHRSSAPPARCWRSSCSAIAKVALLDPLASNWTLIAAPRTIAFPALVAVLLGAGVGVSALGSGLSLRRFLRV